MKSLASESVTFDIFYKKITQKFRPERDSNRLWLLTGTNDLCDIPMQCLSSYHSPQLKYIKFHIFACILHRLRVYLKLTISGKITDGLIAQLLEHCTGIAEVMGSDPVQA